MKRFHAHVAVEKLDESIRLYSTLCGSNCAERTIELLRTGNGCAC